MKAKDLKQWDQFKFPKQRKYKTAYKIDIVTIGAISPQGYEYSDTQHFRDREGHLFVIIENCGQMMIDPEQEVDIRPYAKCPHCGAWGNEPPEECYTLSDPDARYKRFQKPIELSVEDFDDDLPF